MTGPADGVTLDGLQRAIESITGPEPTGGAVSTRVCVPDHERSTVRVALALDVDRALVEWAEAERPGAVVAHRHWGWEAGTWPADVALMGCHDAFDRRFGFGDNPELRHALGGATVASLAARGGYPLGTVLACPPRSLAGWRGALTAVFGGIEREIPAASGERPRDSQSTGTIAIARAMTAALVEEAADHGARVYVTGQARAPALAAAAASGLHVIAVGHRRSERWALGVFARLLASALPTVRVETTA